MTPIRPLTTALLLAAALSGLSGCVLPSEDIDTTPQTPDYQFGHSYTLVQSDTLPRLRGDSLYVDLNYGGCDLGEAITLEHFKTGGSSYEIWLNKTEATPCRAVISDNRRAFKVPDAVKNAASVKLVTPDLQRIELKD